jgi:hypothetical protein
VMSHKWTMEEASADLPRLLEAARETAQFIAVSEGVFKITFAASELPSLDQAFTKYGNLEPDDLQDL